MFTVRQVLSASTAAENQGNPAGVVPARGYTFDHVRRKGHHLF